MATLNQDFIQKQAYQTVNDVLNNYPGGLSGQNAQTFAGNSNSPATSAFNLKSLPIGSTLVLIDGFRFPTTGIAINQGTIPFVEINSIPLAAIDRIEILKVGGSATYGDDAIAGVVNIITKNDYNGADIINYFGESQRGDDEIYHLTNLGTLLVDGIEFGASYVTKEYSWGKLELDANASYIYNYSLKQLEVEPNGFAQFLVTNLTDTAGGSSESPPGSGPDFKIVASIFYSKHVFGNDLFRTGFTLNYENSELDNINDGHGTIPAGDAGLTAPGYVHLVGSWTTVDWQISYEFGPPAEITPETPKPGYDKEGKRVIGEKAIAPVPEGHGWSWRRLLDNTTFTFGIKNLSDAHPPLAFVGNGAYQGYDTYAANPVQRFFYGQIEKKF